MHVRQAQQAHLGACCSNELLPKSLVLCCVCPESLVLNLKGRETYVHIMNQLPVERSTFCSTIAFCCADTRGDR